MSNRTLTIVLISFFILLTAGFMSYYYKVTREMPKSLPVIGNEGHKVDTFSFYNQDGKLVTQNDVKNKVYVVEYFFTTCKGICPKLNESMSRVYQAYRGNPDLMILSHSVDPEHDTVAAMKAYAARFNADPKQWMFLTGSKKRLYEMAFDSYLITAVDSTRPANVEEAFIHDNHFVLVDKNGRLRGNFYNGLEPAEVDSLIEDIHLLLAEKAGN
jgi:protein SCO1/2